MASYETLVVSREGGVGVVELNRPDKLNAISSQMSYDWPAAFGELTEDDDIRAIVLCGAGRAFCAGADLNDPDVHAGTGILDHLTAADTDIIEAVGRCPKPVIAAVHGYCVGGGVEAVVASDFAVAAPDSLFFLTQIQIGIVPAGGGISRLALKVGGQWASRMVFTGERVDAETALRINLTTEVVEDPRGRAMELAGQIAEYPLDALWMAKQGLKDIYELPLSAALRAERQRIFPLYVRQHQEDE